MSSLLFGFFLIAEAHLRREESERERLAEELRLSHERFVLAVAGSQDGLWDWDIIKGTVYFSPRYKEILGYTNEEIPNSFAAWESLIHPDDLPLARKMVSDYHDGRIPVYELEHRLRQKDGSYRWILARGTVLRGADGKVLRMSGSHTDINERKNMDAALRAARDKAVASDLAKSEFLAKMSHELRTPLNAIHGMCELMTLEPLPEPQASRARLASDAVAMLTRIIDDLLDLSKIEAGRMTLEPIPTNCRRLLLDAAALFAEEATGKGLKFEVDLSDSVPPALHVDPLRLRQVVMNLLSNAVKFTEKGSIVLKAWAEPDAEGGVLFHVSVQDTGIGITRETQPLLFQSFVQADTSTTRRYGGTGLGLAISRRLVELMDGRIGVESAPGAGSRFWLQVRLPVDFAASAAADTPNPAPELARLRTLVVEDNSVNRRMIVAILAHLGVRADTAENGAIALEALAQRSYDLVFMDCSMPVMDGYLATEQLRHREGSGVRVPVIAMTAYALKGDRERCLAAGMDDYLSKPASVKNISAVLSRWGAPVDCAALAQAVALIGESAPRWKTEYLQDARRLLQEMRSAKGPQFMRAAHTLKGASKSLGARRLSALCARVESAGTASSDQLDELARELELVSAALT